MKIVIAQTAGFCMGVRRAVDIALDNAEKGAQTIYTIGPLIHNHQTVEMLKRRGIETIDQDNPPPLNAILLIRAHGIPPEEQNTFENNGYGIIDGTCPKVKTVHKVIEKYRQQGFTIVIAGDKGHAEVIGLLGYAGDNSHLVHLPEDIDALPELQKICLVSQTTFDRVTFDDIARKIADRFNRSEVVIKKTICLATDKRQEETRKLAKQVDAMIVVGGKHSANTLRLAHISSQYAPITQHVETEQEIDWGAISGCKTIGITAGASTPSWQIKRVAGHLNALANKKGRTVLNRLRQILELFANLNIFVSLGAVALYYLSCSFQNMAPRKEGAALAFLYFASMYLWNSITSLNLTKHLGMSRYSFYEKHRKMLMLLTILCMVFMLFLSFAVSRELFFLMLIAAVAGSLYHVTIVPRQMQKIIPYKNLKDIPTSRDLFVALAWAVMLSFLPQAIEGRFSVTGYTVFFFCWAFYLAYLRSLFFDLRDIEGDRIMGRETLVSIIGENRVKSIIATTLWIASAILVCFSVPLIFPFFPRQEISVMFLFQLPVILYLVLLVKWNKKISSLHGGIFNIFADGHFYLAGLGALAAGMVING